MSGRSPGVRLFRGLLRLYPRPFRDEHEEELVELFRYRRTQWEARSGSVGPAFWARILADTATTAWRERRHPSHGGRGPRRIEGGDGMRGWADDFVYAGRRLAGSPGFTATALVILVLGIGVNTAAFSVVDALLFEPPPFADPQEVVLVLQDSDDGAPRSTSFPAYEDIRRVDGVFSAVSAFAAEQVFLDLDGALTPVAAEYATSSYMEVIGLTPSRGVWFDASGDDPTGPPMAVLTHRMWRDRLGGDPDVLGRSLRIGGAAVTVVGVGPESFHGGFGPDAGDLWLSISAMGPTGGRVWSLTRREDHPFRVRGRLAPGVTVERAQAAIDVVASEMARTYPELDGGRGIAVLPVLGTRVTPEVDARLVPMAALLMVVASLVLLVAALNLANLLLVRTFARSRELAVRLALGAGHRRLVRAVLAEALLLSALGGAGALALTAGIFARLRKTRFDFMLSGSLDIAVDARVLLFACAASIATGLLFGLLPALRVTAGSVVGALRDDPSATLGARRRFGLTGLLVAGQVAVSVLLLSVAGVFIESLVRAQSADPGFEWQPLAFVRVGTQPLALAPEAAPLLHDRLVETLGSLPGVLGVTAAASLPAQGRGTTTLLLGSGTGGVDRPTEIPWNLVTPGYFEAMGIRIVEGRGFDATDFEGPTVAVVSETMARTYWGRTDVVGEHYRAENAPERPVEIVGVAGDVAVRSLGEPPTAALYWPTAGAMSSAYYLLETSGSPADVLPAVRSAVREVDPRILLLETSTMRAHLGDTLARQRITGSLLGGIGAFALVLAMLGLYGVVSYAVSRRRGEVGIRIALGAARSSVVGLFLRDVAGVVATGGAIGLLLAVPAVRLIGMLFTGDGSGTTAAPLAAALLLATALVATVLPARAAARVDPTRALRPE